MSHEEDNKDDDGQSDDVSDDEGDDQDDDMPCAPHCDHWGACWCQHSFQWALWVYYCT